MDEGWDAIVIGVGGVGSATLYQLARRGLRVVGIDRFPPGHDRGSSHGQTRAIRKAYFEHPSYVPLLHRAYQNWRELEDESGESLFHQIGLLEIGPPNGTLVEGVKKAAQQYGLPLEELSPEDVRQRFPGFALPAGSVGVYEPEGGFLLVEDCVRAYVRLAMQLGGQLALRSSVIRWSSNGRHVTVQCDNETYRADRLVIAAGAWAGNLLGELGIGFRVLRKHLHWYATRNPADYDAQKGSPVFLYETPAGYYYGFPNLDGQSIKVAEHSGGEWVPDPLELDRTLDPQERSRVESFIRQHLNHVRLVSTRHEVCMYTMTADEHFVVDRHPHFPNVCFAAGLSGHGFKFASVLGEILADLVERNGTLHSIDFLRADRVGLAAH